MIALGTNTEDFVLVFEDNAENGTLYTKQKDDTYEESTIFISSALKFIPFDHEINIKDRKEARQWLK